MKAKILIVIPALIACLYSAARADSGACVTIAKCHAAPTLDGRIDAGEWKDAAAISNFIDADCVTTENPNTVAYVMADDKNIYIATRCIEPDPKGPRGIVRKHDDRAFEDDCIQVYLAPEDIRKAKMAAINVGGYEGSYNNWYTDIKAYYEFTVNCKGSLTEAWNDVRDWNAPWTAKVGREKGAWTAEIAIPIKSLGIKSLSNDTFWGFTIFRNRQARRSGFVAPAYGGYTPLPVGAIYITNDHPVARMALTSAPVQGANELSFALVNNTDKPSTIEVTAAQKGSKVSPRIITLAPMSSQIVKQPYTLAGEGNAQADYSVKVQGEGVPMLSGYIGTNIQSKQDVDIRYFSIPAEVYGDIHLNTGSVATKAVLMAQVSGHDLVSKEANLVGTHGTTIIIPAVGKPGEKVNGRLQVFDAKGNILATRMMNSVVPEKFAWLDSKAGLPLKVLPPYKPIVVKSKNVSMIGKTLEYTDFALPARVVTAGKEILAAPIQLIVKSSGKKVAWQSKSWKMLEKDEQHVKIESIWKSAKFDLKMTSNVEYDGFIWNEASIIPHGEQRLDNVSLYIPMKKDVSKYVYHGYAQNGNALSPVGMRAPINQNMWLGDESRGLAWFAESLEWVKSSDYANQMAVIPGKGSTMWRSTFIDTPTTLNSPYTMSFALHVTPAKPVSLKKDDIYEFTDFALPDGTSANAIVMRAKKLFNQQHGTFEGWIKPTFDTSTKDNRSLVNVRIAYELYGQGYAGFGDYQGLLTIYYNGATHGLSASITDPTGKSTINVDGIGTLPPSEWSYMKLSWGDKLRLNVNGKVSELDFKGSFTGTIEQHIMEFTANNFQMDEIRMSDIERPGDGIPSAGFMSDANTTLLYKGENLEHPEKMAALGRMPDVWGCKLVPGKFGKAISPDPKALRIDVHQKHGRKIIQFHENWSKYQGYPDLSRVGWLKSVADACHARGMRFTLYFSQQVSDASPVWRGMEGDFGLGTVPAANYSRGDDRDRPGDIVQQCYTGCGNGPFQNLILDGIAKLVDQAGIDGVYMDGTTWPWICENPTHPGCGVSRGDGTYQSHMPIRAVREFMKRLRSIFVQRGRQVFMDAHMGGVLNLATESFCDNVHEAEQLHRYKQGFRLTPDAFIAGYMAKQFGMRTTIIKGPRTSEDQGVAMALVHDTMVLNGPDCIYKALADYQDDATRWVPYWEKSPLYNVRPKQVLGSMYQKKDKALLVFGSQTEKDVNCTVDISKLLLKLPKGVQIYDAISGEKIDISGGKIAFEMPSRDWRMIEIR